MGDDCPAGEVTTKIPYEQEFDAGPLVDTIEWYFNN